MSEYSSSPLTSQPQQGWVESEALSSVFCPTFLPSDSLPSQYPGLGLGLALLVSTHSLDKGEKDLTDLNYVD